ncbi:MAG: type IV secretory system conjugative DNA transfer family protein [Clostridia bacterium]|nr:type IV secretory system conjugative DNA transfer family protein [Clostridia bacterium]
MNKDKEYTDSGTKGRGIYVFWGAVFLIADLFVFFLYLVCGTGGAGGVFRSGYFWLTEGVTDGCIVVAMLFLHRTDAGGVAFAANDLENTSWMTARKLRHTPEFNVFPLRDSGLQKDGIVVGAEKKGKDVEVTVSSQMHALIVGTTGSGKTTGFVHQNIAIMSMSIGKPSMLIADPKCELYESHAKSLRKRGYTVLALDLRKPYSSARWNPMHVLTRRIRMIKDLEYNLQYENGRYTAAGETFITYKDARLRRQQLMDEIYENAQDLVYTLCPVKNKDQPSWEEGARNLIFGFLLAMCEDCISGKIAEKQMVLFNLYHNITAYCSQDPETLKSYLLEGRDAFSKVKGLVNTVLLTTDRTLACYLSEVNHYMQQLSDDGILSLTIENEIDIINMDERPTAVFMVIPDEKVTRHGFVTLFITQIYKELVEKANLNVRRKATKTATLKRHTYFILDEFGNLPRFPSADTMVTVARSRGIRFLFVLQSFSQLSSRYGRDTAEVIKSNCNIKIFIGSDDEPTRREFSELCGQKKIRSLSISTNSESVSSSNASASTRPLITPGMLERINGAKKGDAIVSVRGFEPLKTVFTPSYELEHEYFPEGECREEDMTKDFNKDNYLYDISGAMPAAMCDEAMDNIERREQEAMEAEESLETLDEKWFSLKREVELTCGDIKPLLKDQDAATIDTIDINYIDRYLTVLLNDYFKEPRARDAIAGALRKITGELLPQMREIQDQARRERGDSPDLCPEEPEAAKSAREGGPEDGPAEEPDEEPDGYPEDEYPEDPDAYDPYEDGEDLFGDGDDDN